MRGETIAGGEVKTMPKEQPLAITPSDDESYRPPHTPLLSSEQVGWNGIRLEYHCQPPHEAPEHFDAEHEINIPYLKHPQKINWTLDGCYQGQHVTCGEIAIVPANVSHGLSWDFEVEFIMLSVAPELVTRTAYESIDPDCIEIVPTLAKPDPLVCQIGFALKAVLETDGSHSHLYAESAATMLAAHLLQHYSVRKRVIPDYVGGLPKYKLKRVVEYIDAHLDRDLSLAAIAAEINMSRYHFSRLFKQATGLSVHQYVIERRVERSKQLLLQGDLNVAEVAFQVGFANPSHLSFHFKRVVGVTPKLFSNK